MPKRARELTAVEIRRLVSASKQGVFAVGVISGLYLQIRGITSTSWILRKTIGSKRREIGLGAYPAIGLKEAREKARSFIEQIAQGIDPILERRAQKAAIIASQAKTVTFEQLAQEFINKKSLEFKTSKQTQKLTTMLKSYAYPIIGSMVVSDIERAHVVKLLEPIWLIKNETARRTRTYIEQVLNLAIAKGIRTGENPARWKGNLDLSLAAPNKIARVEHYASLPYQQLPEFMAKLRHQDRPGAKALELLILTAGRSGEVRNAVWAEFDLPNKVWTVPAERMKAGKVHRVPLCADAIALLEALPRSNEYVFPNSTSGRPITDNTISMVPKRIGHKVTAHGFRSTFKDWCSEHTSYADEVSELALAHVGSDSTRAAYARSELLDKRRRLMDEWALFVKHGADQKAASVTLIGSSGA
ncbi:MAG: integrase arm-type DNA-binding domain-containing protein [Reinekea forsetii]|jgi:integrase|uniref:Integrase n=2 Tax=Reinekea forsetii TaxID=1336806 RepID=A0A2K8KNM4_9GAMM|nr:integrase [Reinekea forsetii]MDO7644097.1 integrase arm-type DNA-binding domain-containing protein [Reinekea forsetii]